MLGRDSVCLRLYATAYRWLHSLDLGAGLHFLCADMGDIGDFAYMDINAY